VGQEARDFTFNPFSLPQTKVELQFLFSFSGSSFEGNEQRYRLDFKEERRLWDRPIERIYCWSPTSAHPQTSANIIGELKETSTAGPAVDSTASCLTTPEDTLSFKTFQTFNFHGWNGRAEVLEPLLFLCFARASNGSLTQEARHPQVLPARRGRGFFIKNRDDPQLRGTGAEDMAQA